jgi:hypothetical protein
MKRSLTFVVLAFVFITGLGVRAQAATPVTCGALPSHVGSNIVTFKLTHDLTCAPSFDPAIAMPDDTVLDLNGHTLSGQAGSGHGVEAIGKDHVAVQNGTIKGFVTPVFFQDGNQNHATRLTLQSGNSAVTVNGTSNALIANNKISGAGVACVDVIGASDTTVKSNKISCTANDVKIESTSTDTFVTGNRITGGTIGVNVVTGGLAFSRVTTNKIRGSGTGIDVGGAAVNENILNNVVKGSTGNGIVVESGADAIDVGGNTANHNGNDGILIQSNSPGIQVGDNTANGNGNYGIEAVPATDDAGGNKAKGNDNDFECLSVICH